MAIGAAGVNSLNVPLIVVKKNHWQRHDEHRALPDTGALGANRAAVKFYEMTHNGKPQTQSAVVARRGSVGLSKSVKDVRQKLRRYPLAAIRNSDFHMRINPF